MSNNVPQKSQAAKEWSLAQYVETSIRPSIEPLLPRQRGAWQSFQVALRSALIKTPKLAAAFRDNPAQGVLAIVKSARLGLSLDPAHEHFALVPYKGEIQGNIMVRGWIHMARQSGALEQMHADVIYRQEYDKSKALRDMMTGVVNHVPHDLERDNYKDEDIVGAYAWVKLKGQDRLVSVVLTRAEIEKRRKKGHYNTPAWREWYPRMCIVKTINALFRSGMVPLTKQIEEAVIEEEEVLKSVDFTAVPEDVEDAPEAVTEGQS